MNGGIIIRENIVADIMAIIPSPPYNDFITFYACVQTGEKEYDEETDRYISIMAWRTYTMPCWKELDWNRWASCAQDHCIRVHVPEPLMPILSERERIKIESATIQDKLLREEWANELIPQRIVPTYCAELESFRGLFPSEEEFAGGFENDK